MREDGCVSEPDRWREMFGDQDGHEDLIGLLYRVYCVARDFSYYKSFPNELSVIVFSYKLFVVDISHTSWLYRLVHSFIRYFDRTLYIFEIQHGSPSNYL